MKKWSFILTLLVVSACLFQACKKNEVEEDFSMDNQAFITQAASSNNLEIQSGTLAAERGVQQLVKDYGADIVTLQTAANDELTILAEKKGLTVSATLIPVHAHNFGILSPLTGELFDQRFAELMVLTHKENVALYEAAAQNIRDEEIRQFAADKLPELRANLETATSFQVQVNQ